MAAGMADAFRFPAGGCSYTRTDAGYLIVPRGRERGNSIFVRLRPTKRALKWPPPLTFNPKFAGIPAWPPIYGLIMVFKDCRAFIAW